jgi:hypothetical protein
MNWRIPFLSIIATIHAVFYICLHKLSDRQGAYAAIEAMVTGYTVVAGIAAIIIDLILMRLIRDNLSFFLLNWWQYLPEWLSFTDKKQPRTIPGLFACFASRSLKKGLALLVYFGCDIKISKTSALETLRHPFLPL